MYVLIFNHFWLFITFLKVRYWFNNYEVFKDTIPVAKMLSRKFAPSYIYTNMYEYSANLIVL